ncbi:MAG: hypothetical protein QOE59_3621, partial [Actinomycetota bacterium]|nr:hypothetical protein [Actinomycetota bacterium]
DRVGGDEHGDTDTSAGGNGGFREADRSWRGSHRHPTRDAPAGAQPTRDQPSGTRGVVVGARGGGCGRLRRGECRLSGRDPTHEECSGRDGSGMSLLDRLVLDLHDVPTTAATAPDPDPGPGVTVGGYVLVYNPPDRRAPGYGQGWTLTPWPPHPRTRATSLAARGASARRAPGSKVGCGASARRNR